MSHMEIQNHLFQLLKKSERYQDSGSSGGVVDVIVSEAVSATQSGSVVNRITILSDTEADNYVSADIGMIYAADIGKSASYIGFNYYLLPVNKDVPLSQRGGFLRRFAFSFGITLNGIEDDRGTRENLFKKHALVVGCGYRVSQYIRTGVGILLFRERDPETFPLTEKTHIAYTPHFSVTFDINVGKHVKGIGNLFDFLKDKKDEN